MFHLHVSRSLYQFQVHGKKISHGQLANQNGFHGAHVSMHGLFFCWPHNGGTSTLTCVAWRFCRAGRRSGVATKNFRSNLLAVSLPSPAFSSPNQNRHATQATSTPQVPWPWINWYVSSNEQYLFRGSCSLN